MELTWIKSIADLMDYLIAVCPNIESLHLGHKEYGNYRMPTSVAFLSTIKFHNLRSLSLIDFQLLGGSFFPLVISLAIYNFFSSCLYSNRF